MYQRLQETNIQVININPVIKEFKSIKIIFQNYIIIMNLIDIKYFSNIVCVHIHQVTK